MFGQRHYMPVMRTKPAELRALRSLSPEIRPWITPLLECPPPVLAGCETSMDAERTLDAIVSHLVQWKGRSVFLDFEMLRSERACALEMMAKRVARAGIRPTVVVSLKAQADSPYARSVDAALSRHGAGVCLRISPEELRMSAIGELIGRHLARHGVSPASRDLVIDRGQVDSGSVRYDEFAHLIPHADAWRSLTVLAGSFPQDLSHLSAGGTYRLKRWEWKQWRESMEVWSGRQPAFGDYAVQQGGTRSSRAHT